VISGHFHAIGNKSAEVNEIDNMKRYNKLYIIEIVNVTEICVIKCLPKRVSLINEIRYPTITNKTVFKPKKPSVNISLARPVAQFA